MQIKDYIESLGFQKLKWNVYGNNRGYEIHFEDGIKVINIERSKVHEEPHIELLLNHIPTKETFLELLRSSNIL
jgi:hypothetical protein